MLPQGVGIGVGKDRRSPPVICWVFVNFFFFCIFLVNFAEIIVVEVPKLCYKLSKILGQLSFLL